MNLVGARLEGDEVVFGQFRLPLDPARRPPAGSPERVVLGIRPEAFEDAAFAPAGAPSARVVVEVIEELGADAHVFFHVDAPRLGAEQVVDGEDDATLLAETKALFNARVDPRTRARVGQPLTLAVDPSRFHLFDPASGSSLLASPAGGAVEPEPLVLTR